MDDRPQIAVIPREWWRGIHPEWVATVRDMMITTANMIEDTATADDNTQVPDIVQALRDEAARMARAA